MSRLRVRRRGEGSIYTRPNSPYYWIKYYHNGKPRQEATGKQPDCGEQVLKNANDAEKKAWAYLDNVMKKVGAAQLGHTVFVGGRERNVTVKHLLDEVVTTYEAKCLKDGTEIRDHSLYSGVKRAKEWFGNVRAMDLTENYWTNWILVTLPSLRERYKAATINRVLAYVRRALRLGVEGRMISYMPSNVSNVMLKKEEAKNARKVFFEWSEFRALLAATKDEDLEDYYWFGYLTGWRSGSIKKGSCQ
jgi:hypothetical protein